jgi:hypothetical protein
VAEKWRAELGGGVRKSMNRKKGVARCCASKIKYVCAAFNDMGNWKSKGRNQDKENRDSLASFLLPFF